MEEENEDSKHGWVEYTVCVRGIGPQGEDELLKVVSNRIEWTMDQWLRNRRWSSWAIVSNRKFLTPPDKGSITVWSTSKENTHYNDSTKNLGWGPI